MNRITETVIEADPGLPVIRTTRDFAEVGVDEGHAKLERMLIDGAA
jgi:hypothetical protein